MSEYLMSGGAILSGAVLAAIAAFIIERLFMMPPIFALVGAALTFLGFMHCEKIGWDETPVFAPPTWTSRAS